MKKKVLIAGMAVLLAAVSPVYAKTTALQDLQDLPGPARTITSQDAFGPNHWAYKTLANVSRKYGLVIGQAGEKFDGNKPLTRNEAAVLLVNLAGKIQQDNVTLSDAEKAQMEILKEELSADVAKLAGRVDKLEATVSKIQASDKKNVKFAYGDSYQVTTGIQTRYTGMMKQGSSATPDNFKLDLAEFGLQGKMQDHLDYRMSLLPSRNIGKDSTSTTMLGDMYVGTDIIPHHTVQLGQTRLPIGVEGALSPYSIDFADRSQITRAYSDTRDLGVKVNGNWKYAEYFAGAYNGARNNTAETNSSMDICSWVNFKPLASLPKYGSLKIGGGYTTGRNGAVATDSTGKNKSDKDYHLTGFAGEYSYKKFTVNGEYMRSDAFSTKTYKENIADGYYYTLKYRLNKKIELLTRYDVLNPNRQSDNNKISEYTVGSNYFFKDRNFMLKTNYVYVRYPGDGLNSHRIVVQTQYKM